MMMPRQLLLHANCVAQEVNRSWRGILLRGPTASGKSDLSLRFLAAGWRLVADDQTMIAPYDVSKHPLDSAIDINSNIPTESASVVFARCPPAIRGLLEIRGLGLMPIAAVESAQIMAIFDLVPHETVERYPENRIETESFFGIAVPKWSLCGFDASAVAKIDFILRNCLKFYDA
ncbi:MAG: aldolase [Alphaproteobacteria bacterium]|nr:aldolase [Alphaproteobacteria bacterium]